MEEKQTVINFTALESKAFKLFMTITIISFIAVMVGFCYIFLGVFGEYHLKTSIVVAVGGVMGFIVLMISGTAAIALAKKYEVIFDEKKIHIKSTKGTIKFNYYDIKKFFMCNETDYSRLKIIFKNGSKVIFYVGLCQMMTEKKTNILTDLQMLNDYFKDFEVSVGGKNGIYVIEYTSKD